MNGLRSGSAGNFLFGQNDTICIYFFLHFDTYLRPEREQFKLSSLLPLTNPETYCNFKLKDYIYNKTFYQKKEAINEDQKYLNI